MNFYKYEATGNDFILVDLLSHGMTQDAYLEFWKKASVRLCDRRHGIGADGILILVPAKRAYAYMHIFNADGSEAAMCGNGIRCAARYLYKNHIHDTRLPIDIDTKGGLQTVRFLSKDAYSWMISVDIARAQIIRESDIDVNGTIYHGTEVDVGNPHFVIQTDTPLQTMELAGKALSEHPHFPDRTNDEFIRPISDNELELAVYERGVGPTLSCGTGCVASAVAFAKEHGQTITIHATGGILNVVVRDKCSAQLQGPANYIFSGSLE
jgi:diaminopimelate epimerase